MLFSSSTKPPTPLDRPPFSANAPRLPLSMREGESGNHSLSRRRPPSRSLWRIVRRALPLYLVLLPLFLLLGVFSYYPALSGIYHSLYDWHPAFFSTFIGLQNYQEMLADPYFWASFAHIFVLFLFGVTLMWALPLLAAEAIIALSSPRWRFIFRTILLIPLAFPMAVQVLIWGFIYDPNAGVLNTFLNDIGLHTLAHNWLGDPHIALYSLALLNFPWIASTPFLIFLSALQAIPQEIFEASRLDGASYLRRVWYIDLPQLRPQFRLLLVLAIIQFLQSGVSIALLTNGGPANATMVPNLYIINVAFVSGDWGYAAALSTFLFVLTLVLSLFALRQRRAV